MATQPTENIIPQLRPLAVDIESLVFDPNNARVHPKRNIEELKSSLLAHGQYKPVVVQAEGRIIRGGNGLTTAAKELGWKKIAACIVDCNEVEAIKIAIRDNRIAETSFWENKILSGTLKSLSPDDRQNLGFSDYELEPLLRAHWSNGNISIKPDEPKPAGLKVTFNGAQIAIVEEALATARKATEEKISDADALTTICQRFIAS